MRFLQIFSSSLGKSPRPTRFYSLLRTLGSVTVCSEPVADGFGQPDEFHLLEKHDRTPVRKLYRAFGLLCHRYEADIWSPPRRAVFERLKGQNFSAIICQEALLVPLALAIRDTRSNRQTPCPVILDAREYYPREFEERFVWHAVLGGINDYVCRKYFPQVDAIFTVSPGLAQGYNKEYGLDCEVLLSCSYYHDITPDLSHGGPLRCIHHGGASSGRKLEAMIEAFQMLEGKATLDVMLMPNDLKYYKKLRLQAETSANITFREPVPMADIVKTVSAYDMGVFFLPDNTFNHRYTLPNKFFEYIQARLALAISPLPDMSSLLRQYDLGVVSRDFTPQSFADAIASLDSGDIARFKHNADAAARTLCWEHNDTRLRKVLSALMEKY